jgi:hypothetical protein
MILPGARPGNMLGATPYGKAGGGAKPETSLAIGEALDAAEYGALEVLKGGQAWAAASDADGVCFQ